MESIRVDATTLSQPTNKTVRIIGQLKTIDSSSTGTINANGIINVSSSTDMNSLIIGNWYEMLGKIQKDDLSINVMEFFDFGTDINENAIKKLVQVAHQVPELFVTE
ncbi:hypothetical protein C6P40_001726 [Pichia californica]|uniref:Replication factor A protein 3 n=1 Tax=Pichia californica TaxID=460514 RepID=A0A9P6WLG5_9ASCO|nr:hypothetical protein C6P42_001769 [[Candida] californica]KAG0687893.1 hypothetical protein C6P40_001726 [[Candida] californica]